MAIEAKQRAEQDSLQMEYVLTKEKQEAERKRVEAQGVADFQKIVTQGISEQLLQWKGIEATEKLALPNTKGIVVGGGKTGLPLILGQ
jgi:prohibitin 1